jgi:hypothetical protein
VNNDSATSVQPDESRTNARQLQEWLYALELQHVAITATVDPSGRLGAIGGLWPKLLAASKDAAQVGVLRLIVVAEDQSDVAPELLVLEAHPLRVLKAASLREVIERLHEEHGPRYAIRRHEREHSATIDLLGVTAPIERCYQQLPLLREIDRERLPRERASSRPLDSPEQEERESDNLEGADILRWEEALQQECIVYERLSLTTIFQHFSSVVKNMRGETPRFVVLGPPGSGKTTLAQYLSWLTATGALWVTASPPLPARVRLRDWETWAHRENTLDRGLACYLAERYAQVPGTLDAAHWRRWLDKGEVLLLLDGLDEISNNPAFHDVIKTTLAVFSACPTVITCRTVSFARYRSLCPDFPLFTLAGFDHHTRNAYIRAFPAEPHAHYDPEALITHLDYTPHLQPLAANPLLLGILCTVVGQRREERLPATRAALYRQALTELLAQQARRVAIRYPGEEPTHEEKLLILQRTAFHLFTQGERRLTFTNEELGQALKLALREEGYGNATAPWANALRADLTQNSGLLRQSAAHSFFFLHVTIQEFLVAAALSRVINAHGWNTSVHAAGVAMSVQALLAAKSWDPGWQEVTMFLAGQLHDPLPLLTMLASDKQDDLFRHRLALAVHCLLEAQAVLSTESTPLVNRIMTTALSYWEQQRRNGVDAAISHVTQALPGLGQLPPDGGALLLWEWLRQRWRSTQPEIRAGAIELIGRIGAVVVQHEEVEAMLVAALQDPSVAIRTEAVTVCRRLGSTLVSHPALRSRLEQLLSSETDPWLRSWARQALVASMEDHHATPSNVPKSDNPSREPSLLHVDANSANSSTQKKVRRGESALAITEWLTRLREQDSAGRARAAHAIGQCGAAAGQHPEALSALLESMLHDRDGGVRSRATAAVGDIGVAALQHPSMLPALLAVLRDQDRGVRAQVARVLGRLGTAVATNPDVLLDLIAAQQDEDRYVRFRAAEALGALMAQGVRLFHRWWRRPRITTVGELASACQR